MPIEDSDLVKIEMESTDKIKIRKILLKKNLKDIRQQILELKNGPTDIHHDILGNDEAHWQGSHGQKYLEINASDNYNLGLLEGKFLLSKIKAQRLIIKTIATTVKSKGYNYKRFLEMARDYEEAIPDEYIRHREEGTLIDEIQGIADSIKGMSFEDVFLQNCFIDVVYGELIPFNTGLPKEYEFGCTTLGAVIPKEDISGKKFMSHPYIGQNFDFNITFRSSLAFVLHQVKHSPQIFSLRLGAMLALPTGCNEYGVKLCVNIIKSNIPGEYTTPSGILSRLSFLKGKNAESVYNLMSANTSPNAYNLMIADKNKLIMLEVLPDGHERRDIHSYGVSSNTFITPSYQNFLIEPQYSKMRQEFAENALGIRYARGFRPHDIIDLLSYKPVLCRTPKNLFESRTLAFITNYLFGMGNPADNEWGLIPISSLYE